MSPSAILVIHNGQTKLVNIRDQDAITKVLDMVPDAVNKVVSIIKGEDAEDKVDPEVESAVNKAAQAEASVVDVDGRNLKGIRYSVNVRLPRYFRAGKIFHKV